MASRIGMVREVAGIAAYRTERWAEALAELRAARRMTGRNDYLAVMADSERALGRLDRALELVHSPEARRLSRGAQIELRIVESGIRRDQGLADAAVLVLQVPELNDGSHHQWSARLFYAYAEALLAAGRTEAARQAFGKAIEADPEGDTDAIDRLDEVDGVTVSDLAGDDDDDDDLEDESEDDLAGDDDEDLDDESDDDLGDDEDDDDLDDESDDDLEDGDEEDDEDESDEDLDDESDDDLEDGDEEDEEDESDEDLDDDDEDDESDDDLDDESGDDLDGELDDDDEDLDAKEGSGEDDDLDEEAVAGEDLGGGLKDSSAKDEPPAGT
jgi:tetratricopeptide (TPR) repeat protein